MLNKGHWHILRPGLPTVRFAFFCYKKGDPNTWHVSASTSFLLQVPVTGAAMCCHVLPCAAMCCQGSESKPRVCHHWAPICLSPGSRPAEKLRSATARESWKSELWKQQALHPLHILTQPLHNAMGQKDIRPQLWQPMTCMSLS